MKSLRTKHLLLAWIMFSGMGTHAWGDDLLQAEAMRESTTLIQLPEESLREDDLRDIFLQIDEVLRGLRLETQRLGLVTEGIVSGLSNQSKYIEAQDLRLASLDESISELRKTLAQLEQSISRTTSEVSSRFSGLENVDAETEARLSRINISLEVLAESIAGMGQEIAALDESLLAQSSHLQSELQHVSRAVEQVDVELADSYVSISSIIFQRSIIGFGTIVALVLLGVVVARRMRQAGEANGAEVKSALGQLQEEQNNLDLKLSEFLTQTVSSGSIGTKDQKFFLNVADEINRMRKRLARLPSETRGLKPLEKALERLEAGLKEEGYEIVPLLGEDYVEGLNVTPRFIPDDTLEPGMQRITNVVSPQVNYQGKIIQVAEVEVSIGG